MLADTGNDGGAGATDGGRIVEVLAGKRKARGGQVSEK